jgi:alpha-glucosidase
MKLTFLFFLVCLSLIFAAWAFTQSSEARRAPVVTKVSPLPDGVEVTMDKTILRVTAISDSVIRFRYAPTGVFGPDESFAVVKETDLAAPTTKVTDKGSEVVLQTNELSVAVNKSSLAVTIYDLGGRLIMMDRSDVPFTFTPEGFQTWKRMPEDEHYYGLGDKAVSEDRREHGFSMWNTDAVMWEESTDPLYKSIPFFMGIRQGKAYGIFLDNTYRTNFQFGKFNDSFYSFGATGGELNYYFINGPQPKRVVGAYASLTGHTPLPPLFTLGYQQCRWSYPTEARVLEVTSGFRKRNIPADVIYLDIDYQDRNRPFTINRQRFPTFEQMIKDLGQTGWKVVAITDLHIAAVPGYKPYDEGVMGGYFVENPDGSNYVGPVWPGPSVFPDFTRAEVRKWWGTLYTEFVNMGIRGFWNDMNEPSVFFRADKTMPLDVVSSVEGRKTDQREIHNVFGLENVRATYEGLLTLKPDLRPFVLTRAAYAGAQRYAATWTGDNQATWNHMRLSLPTVTGLGVSGYPFVGVDVGGFSGSPTPELLTRWTALGTFLPIDRNHAAKGTRDREPWVDGPEHEAIRKKLIEERYRLLPYIYSSMEETTRTGVPLMRLMVLDYPDDERMTSREAEGQYMFGDSLLIAPKIKEFVDGYDMLVPEGTWYDYWTGRPIVLTNQDNPDMKGKLHLNPKLDEIPVFVRAGSIIPRQPLVQNTSEKPKGPLELRVYPGPNCQGNIYTDDGSSFGYKRGEYYRGQLSCESSENSVKVIIAGGEGKYTPWWTSYNVVIVNAPKAPASVTVGGKRVTDFQYDSKGRSVTLTVPFAQYTSEVVIQY